MEKITARTNEKIKYASHLAQSASFRRERGEFLLEGARLCSDAAHRRRPACAVSSGFADSRPEISRLG